MFTGGIRVNVRSALLCVSCLTAIAFISLSSAVASALAQSLARATIEGDRVARIAKAGVPASKSDTAKTAPPAKKTSDSPGTETADRLRTLEQALDRQNNKLDEMQKTIAEQQEVIKLLSAKWGSTLPASASAGDAAVVSTETSAAPQSVEDRLKKVEEKTLKFGRFRFSGDFRLRADAILRSADPTPPPGFSALTHQQNVRARYRLRLNFDTDIEPTVSFHGQLATGPVNNPLTNDQDFSSTVARQPFFINEAWIDYHPNKSIQLQGGRLQEAFADNSKFLFDDDVRFNGFNEKYIWGLSKPFAYITNIEFRAGQYIFSNPNIAVVGKTSPSLAEAGALVGSTGRAANLFHQGVLFNQTYNKTWSGQFGGDVQLYRNPNQIQFASTTDGLVLLVQPGLGIALSGPLTGTGNATTTSGGAIYTARNFQIARFTYRLNWAGFKSGDHAFPVTFNVQGARNMGTSYIQRDAILASVQIGKITKRADTSFLYIFAIKGANSMISQLTDDDLGTNSGVNIRTHAFRFELGLAKKVTFQSLVFIQNELRNSGQFPNFFVPLNAFTPRQYRFQEQVLFTF